MADEWAPKTREDWVGMMGDAFKTGLGSFISEREEAAAKNPKPEDDKTGKEEKESASGGKSAIDRLLGI